MLVLSRHRGERIVMSNGVVVTVIDIYKDTVRLGFDAPDDVRIDREEVSLRISRGEPRKGGAA
jgi:carbon storage regulator